MTHKGWALVVSSFIFSLQLYGCAPPPEAEVLTVTPVSSVELATATLSKMSEPSASNSPAATVQETLTPSPTLSPTPSITPSATPTLTPLPTLDPVSAQNLVLDLLDNNGGCDFPCWWGLTPGQTPWGEAKQFVTAFADSVWPSNDTAPLYSIKFSVPEEINDYGILAVVFELDESSGIEIIRAGKEYPLNEFLTDYGQPDQIYIWAISLYSLSLEARYTIALYYESQGIMVAYDGTAVQADPIQICPSNINEENTYFWFWDPAGGITFEEIGNPLLFQYGRIFNPIDDVTNISLPEFFETYSQAENLNQCFEMPDPDL